MSAPHGHVKPPNGPAPPPGSPPPTAPEQTGPSGEDRLLAAATYVSFFTGFWMVVPIVIYVFKREKSRFVAHHAVRAALFHIVAIPVFFLSWMLAILAGVAVGIALRPSGGRASEGGFALVAWTFGLILPWVVFLVVSGLAAIRAFQGRVNTTSLSGRLVEKFLGGDKTVAAS